MRAGNGGSQTAAPPHQTLRFLVFLEVSERFKDTRRTFLLYLNKSSGGCCIYSEMVLKREPSGERPRLLCTRSATGAAAGRQGTESRRPFLKNKKRRHPWGCSHDAPAPPRGPARPARRPRGLDGARLSWARGVTWWPWRALRAPLGSPPGRGSLPPRVGLRVTVSVGPCGRPPCRDRTEAGARTDIPGVGSWPTAFRHGTWRKCLLC